MAEGTKTYNLFGKAGVSFGAQRLQLSINHFDTHQDTDFTTDPSLNALPGATPPRHGRWAASISRICKAPGTP